MFDEGEHTQEGMKEMMWGYNKAEVGDEGWFTTRNSTERHKYMVSKRTLQLTPFSSQECTVTMDRHFSINKLNSHSSPVCSLTDKYSLRILVPKSHSSVDTCVFSRITVYRWVSKRSNDVSSSQTGDKTVRCKSILRFVYIPSADPNIQQL